MQGKKAKNYNHLNVPAFAKATDGQGKKVANYNHLNIEKRWQKVWNKEKIYQTKDNSKKPKYYILDMFPYPSGDGLHVGHPKGYIATDIMSRMKRMQGYNVLHPMGFDAFGLPAENYAIQNKINPAQAVKKNVLRFKKQLEIIGLDYDWDREINTTDPEYYKWTQFIFLKMYEKGLAYESYEPINWCPSCKTGLANEDLEDGSCERCGSEIEQKPMRQWVLKITDYAERLLKDLDLLDWPESIKESQRNWIGKSEGSEIEFEIIKNSKKEFFKTAPSEAKGQGTHTFFKNSFLNSSVKVFTTRADTLFGATYVVLAPEHPLITQLIAHITNHEEINKYINLVKNKTDLERTSLDKIKTGVELKGIKAINPANGEEIPVYIADYVLSSYGTGAVMAVPAHDQRDFEFAKKYGLEIKEVVAEYFFNKNFKEKEKTEKRHVVFGIVEDIKNKKILCLDWEKTGWKSFPAGGVNEGEDIVEAAKREIFEETGYKNLKFKMKIGKTWFESFWRTHKNSNVFAKMDAYLFELIDDKKGEIIVKEKDQHNAIWIKKEEVGNWINVTGPKKAWEQFQLNEEEAFVDDGILANSGEFDGMTSEEAREKITKKVGGKNVIKYKLRDWVFSRQRYWGEPIPLVHDGDKVIPVGEKDLPVILPKVKSYEPTGTGESPLAGISKWVNIPYFVKTTQGKKDKNGKILKRETNTMPQWAGSSWYYLRYMDPKNKKSLVDKNKEKYWNQVDFYVGGAEHATRHLIYARFWHKFLYDIGIVSNKEPFKKLQSVGLIMGEDGKKMSKRFGNVINPDDIVSVYGADTLRIYEMFMGPFKDSIAWNAESIIGARRFLEKVWRISLNVAKVSKLSSLGSLSPRARGALTLGSSACETTQQVNFETLRKLLHKTIKKVGEDIEAMHFNTAISSMMILVTEMESFIKKGGSIDKEDFLKFLKILSPFAPHIAEEIWHNLGNKKSIHLSSWPDFDKNLIKEDKIKIAVQINGKVRDEILIDNDIDEEKLKEIIFKNQKIIKFLENKEIKKFIYVRGRILSIVI